VIVPPVSAGCGNVGLLIVVVGAKGGEKFEMPNELLNGPSVS
jgi:hypothetical protein